MSKRLDKLRNINEANRVLENRFLNEQKAGTAPTPAKDPTIKMVTKKISGAGLYPTGSATPNPNDPQWQALTQNIMDAIKNVKIPKPISVTVQGSASSVGSPKFDNQKLADDRTKVGIDYLTQNIARQNVDVNANVTFKQAKGVVGNAAVKDSKEALAQQALIVTFPTTSAVAIPGTTAVDSTATAAPGSRETAQQMMDLQTKGMKPIVPVKLFRGTDNKIVPMNQNTFNEINKVLSKYGITLDKIHLGKEKGV